MSAIYWNLLNGAGWEEIGYLIHFLQPHDGRGMVEQLHEAYAHGGGWVDFEGFTVTTAPLWRDWRLNFAGDPSYEPLAVATRTDSNEACLVWPHGWVTVHQADGTFRAARMD